MTTPNINQAPLLNIDEQLRLVFEPYNQKIEPLLETLKSTDAEISNSDESRRRFNASIDALTAEVRGHNKSLQDAIKDGRLDVESALKTRAGRAACLEDIENNKYLDKQAEISSESAKLNGDKVKAEIIDLKRCALNDAHAFLREHLIQHMVEIRPIMLFIGITAEQADAGWSALHNELQNIHSGYEFASTLFHQILNEALGGQAPEGFDSRAFMCDMPITNRFKRISHLQVKARAEKIAAMEEEL